MAAMERLTHIADAANRDRREELEQLQMELRSARMTLQTAGETSARARGALEEAIATATLKREQAAARVATFIAERRSLSQHLEELAARLKARREEEKLLARGAALRDRPVDSWVPSSDTLLALKLIAILCTFLAFVLMLGLRR